MPFALIAKVPCASGSQGESMIFAIRQFCLPFLSDKLDSGSQISERQIVVFS